MDLEKSYQQLLNRVTENYADYRAGLLLRDRQELIDGADRIAKTAEAFQYFTTKPLTEAEVSYFLNFQNPLEVAADHWANCEFELDALGAVMADAADKADDLTLYPLAADASERKPDGLQMPMDANKPDLQKRAAEIARKYEHLPIQDKIGIIAQTFGCTSGEIEISPCSGKWRGTSDISIRFNNGASLSVGNEVTQQAKSAKVQDEYVNIILSLYNPEIVSITKEIALSALKKQEIRDNMVAAQKGMKPYTVLNVELNDGTDDRSSGYMGWYYVTVAVNGKIHAHLESGLAYEIKSGTVGERPALDQYRTAGALKEADVDFVFNNVGFSTGSTLYSLPLTGPVLKRAEQALLERGDTRAASEEAHGVPFEQGQPSKPSIKEQLAVKPVPGDHSAAKTNNREVR